MMKRGNEETDHYAYLKLLIAVLLYLYAMSLLFIVYINETTAVGPYFLVKFVTLLHFLLVLLLLLLYYCYCCLLPCDGE